MTSSQRHTAFHTTKMPSQAAATVALAKPQNTSFAPSESSGSFSIAATCTS